jgi:hypothetical protein
MASSSLVDFTSNINANKTVDYVTLATYSNTVASLPRSSLMKLSTTSENEKFFSANSGFQQRLDNYRLVMPPSTTPINVATTTNNMSMFKMSDSGDYSNLSAYKMQ